jgi:carbon monoxide dehydrogenase subunit G
MVELAGEYDFAAPQELVWELVFDPEILAMTIVGCEKLERVDENTFQGRLNIRVGPVQGVFHGKVVSTDIHPPSSYHILVTGSGPVGVVRGEGNIALEAMPASTRLRYDGAVQVSGRIASVGQRVMDSSAKSIVKQSLQNLEKQIQARLQPEPSTGMPTAVVPTPAPPAPPRQTEFMYNVAMDVLQDLVPDARQRRLLAGVGLAVMIMGLMNIFANLVARRVAKILMEE